MQGKNNRVRGLPAHGYLPRCDGPSLEDSVAAFVVTGAVEIVHSWARRPAPPSRRPPMRPPMARRALRRPLATADNGSQSLNFVTDDDDAATERIVLEPKAAGGASEQSPRETPWLCKTCHNTGFIPCRECGASGVIVSAQSTNVFFCQECTGKKKLRCPKPPIGCGGKCYMCE